MCVPLAFSQSQLGRIAVYRVHGLSYTDYFTLVLVLLGLRDNSSYFLEYTQGISVSDGKKKLHSEKNPPYLMLKLDSFTSLKGNEVNEGKHHHTPQKRKAGDGGGLWNRQRESGSQSALVNAQWQLKIATPKEKLETKHYPLCLPLHRHKFSIILLLQGLFSTSLGVWHFMSGSGGGAVKAAYGKNCKKS